MKSLKSVMFAGLVLLTCVLNAGAVPIIFADNDSGANNNFNSGGDYGPWAESGPGSVNLSNPNLGGHTAASVSYNPTLPQYDTGNLYNSDVAYVGDFTGVVPNAVRGNAVVRSIRFQAYANAAADGAPSFSLQLYFVNGVNTWYYDVGTVADRWVRVNANLNYIGTGPIPSMSGFYGYNDLFQPLSAGQFQADMGSVDEIGLLINYGYNVAGQVVGLDNFTLDDEYFVPEPHQGIMIAVALLSLGVVLRRRMPALLGATVGK